MKTRMLILAFALSFACASEAVAQSGEVGWSEVVGGCTVESGSANHRTSFGVVSFAPAAYGNIYLDCPVTGITRVDPSYINAFGLIFNNDFGHSLPVDYCTVSADFLDKANNNAGAVPVSLANFSTSGNSYSGWTTVPGIALRAFLNFDTDTYMVRIHLVRRKTILTSCNPSVWATFAEEVIQ